MFFTVGLHEKFIRFFFKGQKFKEIQHSLLFRRTRCRTEYVRKKVSSNQKKYIGFESK